MRTSVVQHALNVPREQLQDHTQPLGANTAPNGCARVVMVDDDPIVLEVLSIQLADAGYRDVIALSDSTRAMDLLKMSEPDLLLTDLRMPGINGFELLKQVRAEPRLAYLPVIVLTAVCDAQTKLAALDLGANDFLAKPVDSWELTLRLRNNLSLKAYQDQLALARTESEGLLLSILPGPVAERLKRGETVADLYEDASVLFADLAWSISPASPPGPILRKSWRCSTRSFTPST